MPCWEMIAKGRVQGVGFRWFVSDCANRLQINGYVKNLTDGSVLIIANGTTEALELFAYNIEQGNRSSQVQQLSKNELTNYTEYKEFFIA